MFSPTIYSQRRSTLVERLRAEGQRGLVLLTGHVDSPVNYRDNAYPFRQDSSFLYYAGLAQPELALAIDLDEGTSTLFADDATLDHEVWTGPLSKAAERAARAGIEQHAPRAALAERLASGRPLHLLPAYRAETRLEWQSLLGREPDASLPLVRAVIEQRSAKAPEEIAEMESALAVTREMHLLAMASSRPGVIEQQVVGAIEGLAAARGRRMAYGPIFSRRGEILHNHDHGATLQPGDVIVNDSGVESGLGYASDITRTIPVGGRFEGLKADIYELVLKAQQQAIAAIKPGVPYREVHQLAARVMAHGMKQLGFLKGDADEAVAAGAHAVFFPHGVGHMIGLDVHDMEGLGEDHVGYGEGFTRATRFGDKSLRLARPLREGWVVTVEPGIYLNPLLLRRWRAEGRHAEYIDYDAFERQPPFGVRIEDDVLVTQDGARVLGPAIPKERAQVEALAGS
jgi:Xaa-Pro aminopeptidase